MTSAPSTSRPRTAVVIGGGIIGTACAYQLARRDWKVTILERNAYGKGCSHGNCGFVSPSHVLPLATPGAVRAALLSLWKKDAPLRVRPRFDPALWKWFWHFARCCNEPQMLRAGQARLALLASSFQLYEELFEQEPIACEWQHRGLLFVYRDREEWAEYSKTDRLLREEFDMPARPIEGRELATFEPALQEGLAGAWFYDDDAHLRPDRLLGGWRTVLERMGVQVVQNAEVLGWQIQGERAVAARTPGGDHPADVFIAAAGALTPQFARPLGTSIPIQPGKGYSITMARPELCPQFPMIFAQHKVAVTPMESAYRLGSTMEFAGYDSTLRPERLRLLTEGARIYLREPLGKPVTEQWCGWRPMTWDGVPIIDFSPRLANVLVAAGHNMLGLSMAPATGRLAAELVSGETPHIDPVPYRLARFRAGGRGPSRAAAF